MPTFSARFSPWRLVLLLLFTPLFAAISASMTLNAELSLLYRALGGASCLISLSLVVIAVIGLLDRSEQVRVAPDGIYYKRWSETVIPWDEIVDVTVFKDRYQNFIMLRLADPQRFPSTTLVGRLGRANRRLAGGDVAISLTYMDRSFDDAMTVIEDYRATSAR
ncbi:STM3941 family protein [Mycobacterium sp. NPDC049093]